ncbi:hypothetical protein BpHYR1_029966, partial [Brachionus plicatilis]
NEKAQVNKNNLKIPSKKDSKLKTDPAFNWKAINSAALDASRPKSQKRRTSSLTRYTLNHTHTEVEEGEIED